MPLPVQNMIDVGCRLHWAITQLKMHLLMQFAQEKIQIASSELQTKILNVYTDC